MPLIFPSSDGDRPSGRGGCLAEPRVATSADRPSTRSWFGGALTYSRPVNRCALLRRLLISLSFLIAFLLLTHPEVILLSRLGTVVWYPAAGLSLALLLGVGPSYAILVAAGTALAGRLFYGQSFLTYGETIGAVGMAASYTAAAHILRNVLKIDLNLRRRADVFQYVAVTTGACLVATVIGVACLAADHSISWDSFPKTSLLWFLGDEIALLGVAPFLLIHVFPWIRRLLSLQGEAAEDSRDYHWTVGRLIELTAQGAFLLFSLWLSFSPRLADLKLLYFGFIPVIWIAVRHGIKRVATGLLVLNFGVVIAAHLFPPEPAMLTQYRLFMFVLSAVGLIVGSAITERHWIAIELLNAKHRAEEANRIKGQFLANMSHEIRTPINGVLGMTELVLGSNPTEEQREYLEILKASGDFLLGVINDVLDFSRIEAGKLTIENLEFDVRDLTRDTLKSLSLRAHEKSLELAYHVDPTIPEKLVGDSSRLRQILLNLVGNAIKFTPVGDVIVEVRPQSRDDQNLELQFAVRDTGIGIADEKQKLIFEPFAQVDGSTTRTYGGSGLGLSICSRLLQLMNGSIWLESSEGKGSTFYFSVPLRFLDTPSRDQVPSVLAKMPVLVVDDNEQVRRILVEMMAEWGMLPVAVEDGRAALQALEDARVQGEPFRLAILDSEMPQTDGLQLAERIRENPDFSNLPLLITAYPGKRHPAEFYRRLGVAARLLKPVGSKELLQGIMRTLGEGSANVADIPEQRSVAPEVRPLRILVVEDNAINQVVAVDMLQRLGNSSVVAGNGQEGLERLKSERFDLVLMDVQMPVKDGLTTTQEIREQERTSGAHIPIIAMTAHAMKGDKERCLAAGMDAYLTKPVSAARLRDAIESVLKADTSRPIPVMESMNAGKSWNIAQVRGIIGDEALLREVLQIFAEETPKQLAELEAAIAARDAGTIQRVAHTLKGELGFLGMTDAVAQARDLERMGRDKSLDSAAEVFQSFKATLMAAVLSAHDSLAARI